MQNNEENKLTKPISETILSEEFEEVKVPFLNKRLYNADPVDRFLSKMSTEVESLEKASKRLVQFYEKNKSNRVAESNSGPMEEKTQVDDVEMMQVLKSKGQRMDRMQKHIAELFEEAVTKADAVIAEAEVEKNQIIQQAETVAGKIIAEAQKKADEINRVAEDKIKEAKLVKFELNQKAQEIQTDIILKANQLDDMQGNLTEMSKKLRRLVEGTSA